MEVPVKATGGHLITDSELDVMDGGVFCAAVLGRNICQGPLPEGESPLAMTHGYAGTDPFGSQTMASHPVSPFHEVIINSPTELHRFLVSPTLYPMPGCGALRGLATG